MLTNKTALFLFTETSLHAGTGAHLGVVDLPIQRERHTGYPIVQGSGVKGALRAALRAAWDPERVMAAFGPDAGERAHEHAGAVSFSDARVALFPVRAPGACFVWVTCPTVLARLQRDLGATPADKIEVPPGKALVSGGEVAPDKQILLEEHVFEAVESKPLGAWASWFSENAISPDAGYAFFKSRLKTHLVAVRDEEFQDLVLSTTEVVTRVKLDEKTKTVARGALWTEEALPSDTLLWSVVHGGKPSRDKAPWSDPKSLLQDLSKATPPSLQIGGDETTGRGWVTVRWGAS